MSLRRVTVIDNVYHGRKGYEKELFFMHIKFFLQLHVKLPFCRVFILNILYSHYAFDIHHLSITIVSQSTPKIQIKFRN